MSCDLASLETELYNAVDEIKWFVIVDGGLVKDDCCGCKAGQAIDFDNYSFNFSIIVDAYESIDSTIAFHVKHLCGSS